MQNIVQNEVVNKSCMLEKNRVLCFQILSANTFSFSFSLMSIILAILLYLLFNF